MPNGMLPVGYRAVLLGEAASIDGLRLVAPLEEVAAEGTLMLMRLDFAEYPSLEGLGQLEVRLREAGVPSWPGYPFLVYADTQEPGVYLAWQKQAPFTAVIIGILVTVLLPTLLGAFLWWLLPEPMKDLLNMMAAVGVMVLVMSVVEKIMPGRKKRESARVGV